MSMMRIEPLGNGYVARKIIERSKDTDIIYLTDDVILDTHAVKELAESLENSISKNKIKEKIEQLKNEISYIGGECDEGCNKCFDKDWKPLYRGANFNFCYAYHQIKVLQEILKEE